MAAEEMGPAEDLRKEVESLRAKVVELEQKLSKLCITEEEWKTYRKVAAVLAGQAGVPEGGQDEGAAGAEDFKYGCLIHNRRNPHMLPIKSANIVQGHSIVIPTIIIGGFGNLGF